MTNEMASKPLRSSADEPAYKPKRCRSSRKSAILACCLLLAVVDCHPRDMHLKQPFPVDSLLGTEVSVEGTLILPERIVAGEEFVVSLVIRASGSESEVLQRDERFPRGFEAFVTPQLVARLTSLDLQIELISSARQALASNRSTQWQWSVRAIEPGPKSLHFSLDAEYDSHGRLVRTAKTEEIPIEVKRKPLLKSIGLAVRDYWQWICTVILLPLITMAWRRLSKSRRRKAPIGFHAVRDANSGELQVRKFDDA